MQNPGRVRRVLAVWLAEVDIQSCNDPRPTPHLCYKAE